MIHFEGMFLLLLCIFSFRIGVLDLVILVFDNFFCKAATTDGRHCHAVFLYNSVRGRSDEECDVIYLHTFLLFCVKILRIASEFWHVNESINENKIFFARTPKNRNKYTFFGIFTVTSIRKFISMKRRE